MDIKFFKVDALILQKYLLLFNIMKRLISVNNKEDVSGLYKGTPISQLLEYHNLKKPFEKYSSAQLLVGMCMDHRKKLDIPNNFAYIIRTGGANMRYNEFKISYAIAVGGVKHVALIGHDNCGMVGLSSKKEQFVKGLIDNAGWTRKEAEAHFNNNEPLFEIEDEIDFTLKQTLQYRKKYPKIIIAPLLYKVGDNKLYIINED